METNLLTSVNINGFQITSSTEEKLIGTKFDSKLSFENHVSSLCKKASQKLHSLTRIINYMNLPKPKALMKTFVIPQFNYYPLIWMFHSRELNNRITIIHERKLKVTYQDYNFAFIEILQKNNSLTIHQWNLQVLATDIYKGKNDSSPEIMKEFFELKEPSYSLHSQKNYFVRKNVKTTHYGIQSIKYLAPKIRDLAPGQVTHCGSLTKT